MQEISIDYLSEFISIEQRYIISNKDISASLQKSLEDSINNQIDRHIIKGLKNSFIMYRNIGGKFLGSAVLFEKNESNMATVIYTDSPYVLLDFKNIANRMNGLNYELQVKRSLETFKILKDKYILQNNINPNIENSKNIINKLKI